MLQNSNRRIGQGERREDTAPVWRSEEAEKDGAKSGTTWVKADSSIKKETSNQALASPCTRTPHGGNFARVRDPAAGAAGRNRPTSQVAVARTEALELSEANQPPRPQASLALLPPEMNALFAHSYPVGMGGGSLAPGGCGRGWGRGYALDRAATRRPRSSTLAGRPESSACRFRACHYVVLETQRDSLVPRLLETWAFYDLPSAHALSYACACAPSSLCLFSSHADGRPWLFLFFVLSLRLSE